MDISHHYTAGLLEDPVLRAAVRLSIEPGPYQTAESYAEFAGGRHRRSRIRARSRGAQVHVEPMEAARTLVGCYSGVQMLSLALAERDALHQQVSAMWALVMPGIARPEVFARLRLGPPRSMGTSPPR